MRLPPDLDRAIDHASFQAPERFGDRSRLRLAVGVEHAAMARAPKLASLGIPRPGVSVAGRGGPKTNRTSEMRAAPVERDDLLTAAHQIERPLRRFPARLDGESHAARDTFRQLRHLADGLPSRVASLAEKRHEPAAATEPPEYDGEKAKDAAARDAHGLQITRSGIPFPKFQAA